MYANRKHERIHAKDCEDWTQTDGKLDRITRTIQFIGDLDEKQIKRLTEIADRCPVHRTLENNPIVTAETL